MPSSKASIAGFLAITAMIGFLAVMSGLFLTTIPTENRDFFNLALMALVGFCGTAFGYFLGTSKSSAQKDETIAKVILPPKTPESGSGTIGLITVLLLSMVIILAGCAGWKDKTTEDRAAQTLLYTQSLTIGIAEGADAMCSRGALKKEQCDRIYGIYVRSAILYDRAADLLITAEELNTPEAWTNYQAGNTKFYSLFNDLTTAATELGIIVGAE